MLCDEYQLKLSIFSNSLSVPECGTPETRDVNDEVHDILDPNMDETPCALQDTDIGQKNIEINIKRLKEVEVDDVDSDKYIITSHCLMDVLDLIPAMKCHRKGCLSESKFDVKSDRSSAYVKWVIHLSHSKNLKDFNKEKRRYIVLKCNVIMSE